VKGEKMFKRIVFIVCVGMFFFGTVELSYSQEKDKGALAQARAQKVEAVNVGNKICPVSGGKIVELTKATYEYEGKIYNFCCAMCIDSFKQDPQKYLKKVAEEQKSEKDLK
jgi:YHS domain-containing protein